jgi:hypothetical protein
MFLNMMIDWAGCLLMLFSFSIVFMWRHVRNDTKVVCAIWFCLLVHHAVVFLNVYIPDADSFHAKGALLASFSGPEWLSDFNARFKQSEGVLIDSIIKESDSVSYNWSIKSFFSHGAGSVNYIHFLGFMYRFSASLFYGKELSILTFVLSCVVLVKLLNLLDLRSFRVGIILLFGLLPSAVVHRTATLREPWQALFFLLFLYWTIRLWKRPGILILLFMLMSALGMAFLHHGLTRYAIYLIVMGLYWGIFSRKMDFRWSRPVRFLFAGLLITCVIILTQKMGVFMTLEEAVEGGRVIRQNLLSYTEVRTNFSSILDTSSLLGIVTTFPMIFVEYMFAPFPWQIENVKDICAFLESMLRFLLLFLAISLWRRSSGEVRSCYGFLLIAVLGIECVWALGTANWGTAIRHHVPGYSVFVLLGAPRLILFVRELQFGMFGRRKVSGKLNEQSQHMS